MGMLKRSEVRVGSVMGLILGGILALNAVGIYFLNTGGAITIIPCLGAYVSAGYRAAQSVRAMWRGAIAGFLTGVISSLVGGIAMIVVVATHLDAIRERVQAEAVAAHQVVWYTTEQILTQRVFGVVAGLALASLVGTGGGMLGAAMRRTTGKAPPTAPQ